MYLTNNIKIYEERLKELKNRSTIIVRDLNTPFSVNTEIYLAINGRYKNQNLNKKRFINW